MPKLIKDERYNDMTFLQQKDKTVCFTGHRTQKFLDNVQIPEKIIINSIKTLLTLMTADAYNRGARYFLTGMAYGVDLWAGELLLYMKQFLPDLHIIAVVPHQYHENYFYGREKELLYKISDSSDAVVCTAETPSKWCFIKRNDYMLEHSSTVLGILHVNEGGTLYTLKKAAKKQIPRRIINVQDYRCLIPMLERFPEICRLSLPSQQYEFCKKNPMLLYQCGLFKQD